MPRTPTKKPAKAKRPAAKPSKAGAKATKPVAKPAGVSPKPAPKAKPKAAAPVLPKLKPGTRTIPVHALADDRIHLAAPHHGRLKQGTLRTLCGLIAVSALSPFALADKKQERCRTCFRKVDQDGLISG